MLRRIRAILGTALTWGAVWAVLGVAGGVRGLFVLAWLRESPSVILLNAAIGFGASGVIAGAIFALALGTAERRTGSLHGLSIRRTGVWGAIGGLTLPLLFAILTRPFPGSGYVNLEQMGIGIMLGTATAVGSLVLERRAPKEPPQLGPADVDFAPSRHDTVGVPAAAIRP
jgi:hypothetical protein